MAGVQPGSDASMVPMDGITRIVRRIEDIERTMREDRAALLNNQSLTGLMQILKRDGVSVVAQMGTDASNLTGIRLYYGNGTLAFFTGQINGTQTATYLYRDDGSLAFGVYGSAGQPEFAAILDRAGNVIVSDDTVSGTGLAKPHIESSGLHDTNIATWPATSSGTFTTIADGYLEIQNPRLTWQATLFADVATTAEFCMLVNGTQVGSTQTVANAAFVSWSTVENRPVSTDIGDVVLVQLQARITAGAGTAKAQVRRLAGWQS
jgi:hypothetical protein